jgi:hypothetical protein
VCDTQKLLQKVLRVAAQHILLLFFFSFSFSFSFAILQRMQDRFTHHAEVAQRGACVVAVDDAAHLPGSGAERARPEHLEEILRDGDDFGVWRLGNASE